MSEPTPASALRCPSCGAAASEDAGTCGYCGANLAVVGCPSCFAHLFAGMRYCPRCGTETARTEEGATDIPCPDCRTPLARVRVGALTLGECATCRGLWLDAELFGRLIDSQETRATVMRWHVESASSLVAAVVPRVRYRACPRCRKLMNRVNFARVSKVIVDVCKTHGTWFDRDELFRVVTFVQDGGLERTHEVERERDTEEKRRMAEQLRMIAHMNAESPRPLGMAQRQGTGSPSDPFGSPIERFLAIFLS